MTVRILSFCLIITGCLSLMNGLALPVLADPDCQDSVHYPGHQCEAAHARDRHKSYPSLNYSCIINRQECGPQIDSVCGNFEGYQHAAHGICIQTLQTSGNADCTEGGLSTFVPLTYYVTKCMINKGQCVCMYISSTTHPIQYSEVCDCYE